MILMRIVLSAVMLAMACLTLGCQDLGPSMHYKMEVRRINLDTDPAPARVTLISPVTHESTFLGTTPLREQAVPVLTSLDASTSPWAPSPN